MSSPVVYHSQTRSFKFSETLVRRVLRKSGKIMKSTVKERFKTNLFVKPLYRKLKNRRKIKPSHVICVDSKIKLDGKEVKLKRNIKRGLFKINNKNNGRNKKFWYFTHGDGKERVMEINSDDKGTNINEDKKRNDEKTDFDENAHKDNKKIQVQDRKVISKMLPATWLRFHPAPQLPTETVGSVVLRCLLSQLGLLSGLVLWTAIWVFVIQLFEGPYEIKMSEDFEKAQRQLVIDLATELRQIKPTSPRWKDAIEQRLLEARYITMEAIGGGARLPPAQQWDLSGTFLFTVYVMTALGFGAPVPRSTYGRISTLIYAIVAAPTHIYLMYHASMCIVVYTEKYLNEIKSKIGNNTPLIRGKQGHNYGGNSRCSQETEHVKLNTKSGIEKIIMHILNVGYAVVLVSILYYLFGVICFGVMRQRAMHQVLMFPLEFTTNGGLDNTEGLIRILYGLYVEGAMTLLACALASLRRRSSGALFNMADKYRLFDSFGAPVPRSTYGRISTLIYAIVAAPTHIYLMYHASMCIVVYTEKYLNEIKSKIGNNTPVIRGKQGHNYGGNSRCSQETEHVKLNTKSGIEKIIMHILNVSYAVVLVSILYYLFGVICFGVMRQRAMHQVLMFPLEFTTNGGLDNTEGLIRILYGLYVEGAMTLLACALASLRRRSSGALFNMADKYRLFDSEE